MHNKGLNIISIIAGISLIGILIAQSMWLRKTSVTAQKQYDHRADQMLSDVVEELQTYADTSDIITLHKESGNLVFYDVVDTVLLRILLHKYANYHSLDTELSYSLVYTGSKEIIYKSQNFEDWHEKNSYKVCLSCIWQKEYIHLSVFFLNKSKNIRGSLIIWIIVSLIFTLASIGAFIFIMVIFFKQKKIAEIKNDFVNNMTHELKTPISTISVASEVLLHSNGSADNSKTKKYSRIIFDENQRMRKLVDKVLNIATLEKGRLTIDTEETNIHSTICKTVSNFCLEACDEDVKINYKLNAKNPIIQADILHLRNIMNNLIDNAIKYSQRTPEITIKTENVNNELKLSVIDNGKGIPRDALDKVFDKFYRVPAGYIHNVKGFGLGLYYVKTMIEAHKGYINITSAINKGTSIELYLPQ